MDIRGHIVTYYSKNPLCTIFVFYMVFIIALYSIMIILSNGQTLYYSTCPDKNDLFMDHFNSIMYSLNNPYTGYHVIYPPLITCVYAFIGCYISQFVPGCDKWSFALRDSYFGMLTYFMIVIIALFLLYKLLNHAQKKENTSVNELLTICLIASFPLTYAIARGNCIIYALIFLLIFILNYNSENKYYRYIAYIAIAISTGIKIFPAIFTLLILREKRYKETLLCILFELMALFVPFIFTDGNIFVLMDTALNYTSVIFTNETLNIQTILIAIAPAEFQNTAAFKILSYLLIAIVYIITIVIALFDKKIEHWKLLVIITSAMILGLGTPAAYSFIYFVIPAILFFSTKKDMTKTNIFVTICFIIIMSLFICDGNVLKFEYMTSFKIVPVVLMFVLFSYEGFRNIIKSKSIDAA